MGNLPILWKDLLLGLRFWGCDGLWHFNVDCNRLNCKPTYECTTRKSWRKRVNRCYWHREVHSDSSLCNGCYYYGFTLFVFDSLIMNNIRRLWKAICMFWELVQVTVRYLRSFPWFREKVPEKKNKPKKKKTKWQKKKGKHR